MTYLSYLLRAGQQDDHAHIDIFDEYPDLKDVWGVFHHDDLRSVCLSEREAFKQAQRLRDSFDECHRPYSAGQDVTHRCIGGELTNTAILELNGIED